METAVELAKFNSWKRLPKKPHAFSTHNYKILTKQWKIKMTIPMKKMLQWSLTCLLTYISGKPLHWWFLLTALCQMICTTSKFCTTFQRKKRNFSCPNQINHRWHRMRSGKLYAEIWRSDTCRLEPNHCLNSLTDPRSAKYWPQVEDPNTHTALVLEIWFNP